MNLPIKATAAGLLIGIVLVFILQPYLNTPIGIALLLIICVLAANCAVWLGQALIDGRK